MLRTIATLLGMGRQSENREHPQTLRPPRSHPRRFSRNVSSDVQPPVRISRDKPAGSPRLHHLPLNKLGLFGPAWRQRLAALGIHTAAQFLDVSSEQWQRWGMTDAETRKLRRWEKAVRLASSMPKMKPYEAMMLFAIHRRRLSRLASERPGRLHRDLLRFALSSRGNKLLRARQVPDRQRVERWIQAARTSTSDYASCSSSATIRSRSLSDIDTAATVPSRSTTTT